MVDINKGIVVRGLSKAGAFAKEELDAHGRLDDASVNSKEGTKDASDLKSVVVGMNKLNFKNGFSYTTAEKIKQKGGRVMKSQVSGNVNHCRLCNLTLSDANNLFSNQHDWSEIS